MRTITSCELRLSVPAANRKWPLVAPQPRAAWMALWATLGRRGHSGSFAPRTSLALARGSRHCPLRSCPCSLSRGRSEGFPGSAFVRRVESGGLMDVEERLARLERENHHLRVAGLIALAIAASVFLMGQVRPAQRVTAHSFAVTNDSGEIVALFGATDERGLPYLSLYSPGRDQPSVSIRLAYIESENPQDPSSRRSAVTPVISLVQPPLPGSNTAMLLGLELDPFAPTPRISMTHTNGYIALQMNSQHILISDPGGAKIWEAP